VTSSSSSSSSPPPARADGDPLTVAVAFVRRLRRAGLDVAVHGTATFAEALELVGMTSRSCVYWSGRATLVHRPADLDPYDVEFARFWDGTAATEEAEVPPDATAIGFDDPAGGEGEDRSGEAPEMLVRFSDLEVLRKRDFAHCSPGELAELHRAIARLRVGGPVRRSRRRRPSRRAHGRPDLRRTLREALRTGGDPVHRPSTLPRERPRRLVLLFDVSGSMAPYARALVRFAHAATAGRPRVEVFAIGTRLTRITRAMAGHDPDRALDAAAAEVSDWSGGTRLGTGLRAFNDRWGARGLGRGAVVVVLSDGWDRGDPAELGAELGRLRRVAHEIIWVNPLAGTPGWEPTAGGMAAALPHVDHVVSGHSLASLEDLVDVIAGDQRYRRTGITAAGPERNR